MRTHALAAIAIAALGTACESVAPVDIHYATDAGDAGAEAALLDAGVVVPTDGDPAGEGGLCGCNFPAGEGCCVPTGGTAFCTTNRDGCAQQGGIYVGCAAYDQTTDSLCCWSGAATGGSEVVYATACSQGPSSCATSADCNGGTCLTAVCGGIVVGACDVPPTCP